MTTTDTGAQLLAPPPAPDLDSQTFWSELRAHRIVLQRCTGCDRRRFPAMPSCPYCAHPEWRSEEISGTGTVFSYIVVHLTLDPVFAADVPYPIATIELDGGGRIVARLDATPSIGTPVAAVFVDHPEWTELRFRIVEEG